MIEKLLEIFKDNKGFTLGTSTGYSIWITRLPARKNYTLAIAKPGTNEYIKVGTITNIDLFRKVFYGDTNEY